MFLLSLIILVLVIKRLRLNCAFSKSNQHVQRGGMTAGVERPSADTHVNLGTRLTGFSDLGRLLSRAST